jgi:hypothetical protein
VTFGNGTYELNYDSIILIKKRIVSYLINKLFPLRELNSSLPRSQPSSINLYPEPVYSSPHLPALFLYGSLFIGPPSFFWLMKIVSNSYQYFIRLPHNIGAFYMLLHLFILDFNIMIFGAEAFLIIRLKLNCCRIS